MKNLPYGENVKFDLVVAHYKENIDWIKSIKKGIFRKIFVYSKGSPNENLSDDTIEHKCLPNVGRESHTYITHCINEWQDTDRGLGGDFTFFVQGSPHGMSIRSLEEWSDLVSSFGLDFTLNYKFSSPSDFLSEGRCRSWAGATSPADFGVREWCHKYVAENPKMSSLPIFWNACFGVSSKCIMKSDWRRLVTLAQEQLSSTNPECGHYCERLWYYIFRMDSVTIPELPENVWYLWGGPKGLSHYGSIRLNDDGKVGLYENNNESFWRKDGRKIVLMDRQKKETCILEHISDDEYSGPFLRASNSIHRLTRRNIV